MSIERSSWTGKIYVDGKRRPIVQLLGQEYIMSSERQLGQGLPRVGHMGERTIGDDIPGRVTSGSLVGKGLL